MGCIFRRPKIYDTMLFVAISLITVLRSENSILGIFYYQFFSFFVQVNWGSLSFFIPMAFLLSTVCMFHYSNVNWAVSMLCCAQWQKLKRWAFHMGHVIKHWLRMTSFIGLPVTRSLWYCDCVMSFVPRLLTVWLIHALWSWEVLTSLASLEGFASESQIMMSFARWMSSLLANPYGTLEMYNFDFLPIKLYSSAVLFIVN